MSSNNEEKVRELTLRIVLKENSEKFGETICVVGKRVIVKKDADFYSIPINKLKEKFGDLVLSENTNMEEAKKLGDAWKSKSTSVLGEKNAV